MEKIKFIKNIGEELFNELQKANSEKAFIKTFKEIIGVKGIFHTDETFVRVPNCKKFDLFKYLLNGKENYYLIVNDSNFAWTLCQGKEEW